MKRCLFPVELGGHRTGLGNEIIQFEVPEIGWGIRLKSGWRTVQKVLMSIIRV